MLTYIIIIGWDGWAVPEESGWRNALSLWHARFNLTALFRPTSTNFFRHARKWWCDGDVMKKMTGVLWLSMTPPLPPPPGPHREKTDHLLTNNGPSVYSTMCWSSPVPVLSSTRSTLFNRCWSPSVINQHLFGKYVYTQPFILEILGFRSFELNNFYSLAFLEHLFNNFVCVLQAASYGIGVMAQHCAKDFRQACLGMPWGIKFNKTNLPY